MNPGRLGLESLTPRQITLGICLALVAAVVLLYAQVAGHAFINLDDPAYYNENSQVRAGLTWQGVRWAFSTFHLSNWHPLTWLSYMLDAELFGAGPRGPLLVNVALHASNAVLLFLVLRLMTGALWTPALVAAMFALHPLRVESVAWLAERKDVLSGLFWMLTLLAYTGYARRPGTRRYLLVCALFTLGLMSKPILVTLPCVLLLLDFWPLHRTRNIRLGRLVLEKLPLLGLSAVSCVITLQAQRSALSGLDQLSLAARVSNALVSYVAYLWKALWPTHLAVLYPHPAFTSAGGAPSLLGPALAAGLLLAITSGVLLYLSRRRPYLAVGWFWYLGTLLPVIGVVQVGLQAMADRYTYLPLVGVYLALAWAARDLAARAPSTLRVVSATSMAVLVAWMTATWFQVGTWRDSRTLYEHTLRVTERNYLAHNTLGLALVGEGRLDEAQAEYEQALRIQPAYADAHTHLGAIYEAQGKLDEAEAEHRLALRLRSDYAKAHAHLGIIYTRQEKFAEAEAELEQALRLEPDGAFFHHNLGILFEAQGRLGDALLEFERALSIKLDYAEAHVGLGQVLTRQAELARAEGNFARALSIKPDLAEAHNGLGIVLTRQGKPMQAAAHYEEALRIDPDYAEAQSNLGVLYELQGQLAAAAVQYERALALKPDDLQTRRNLDRVRAASRTKP